MRRCECKAWHPLTLWRRGGNPPTASTSTGMARCLGPCRSNVSNVTLIFVPWGACSLKKHHPFHRLLFHPSRHRQVPHHRFLPRRVPHRRVLPPRRCSRSLSPSARREMRCRSTGVLLSRARQARHPHCRPPSRPPSLAILRESRRPQAPTAPRHRRKFLQARLRPRCQQAIRWHPVGREGIPKGQPCALWV